MGRSANSRNRVFTARDGGIITEAADPAKLEERQVVLGVSDDAHIQITSGLAEGDTVVYQTAGGMGEEENGASH